MSPEISHEHHYVPRWYQRRFLAPGHEKLWYLDLKPERVVIDRRRSFTRQALRRMYPAECFWLKDLYILRFGKNVTDVIEKIFFGTVDAHGHKSVRFFATHPIDRIGLNPAYNGLLGFIAAQRLRTPRGLDWLRKQAGVQDQNRVLMVMREMFEAYNAMWMEGTWEIVSARNSATKFIISDDPVTFFNRKIYPGEAAYPGGDDFPKVGTRTIFPLGPDFCLIITHLQLIRNPRCKPLETRVNARLFGTTLGYLVGIQNGRELDEIEVARINYILKKRATKYIAAGRKEDLYPEAALGNTDWSKLDDDWFLLPNVWKVHFTSGMVMGMDDGRRIAIDEYGRNPRDPAYQDQRRRALEHQTFEAGKREWAKKRVGKPLAQTLDVGRENAVYDRLVREYLQEEGLIPREEPEPEHD
jgi:hypothetical protein